MMLHRRHSLATSLTMSTRRAVRERGARRAESETPLGSCGTHAFDDRPQSKRGVKRHSVCPNSVLTFRTSES